MDNTKETLLALPEVLNELSVVTREDNGRSRVFAHRDMVDVTKRPPARGVAMETLEDLIAWLKKYGEPDESAVYFSSSAKGRSAATVGAYLSEEWRGQNGLAKFELAPSKALSRWLGSCNGGTQEQARRFTQEDLLKFLEAWGPTEAKTPGGDALLTVQKTLRDVALSVKVSYKKEFEDENNVRLEFSVKEDAPSKGAQLPKKWTLLLPIFEGEAPVEVPVRFGYNVPTSGNEGPVKFYFEAATLPAIYEAAVEAVRARLKNELGAEWQVFRGEPFVSSKDRTEEASF